VVHRDLKPANVMRCGADGRVVLTDFGIARLADGHHPPKEAALTANQAIGTPAYMAPEQVEGGTVDGRTDVYALGTLLFEMLTGQLPFQRPTTLATLAARLAEDAPDARTIDATIPPPIALLVARALSRRRGDRPDAETALQELERLRGGGARRTHATRARDVSAVPAALARGGAEPVRTVAIAPVDAGAGTPWSADDVGAALADGVSSLRGVRVVPPEAMQTAIGEGSVLDAARRLGAAWLVATTLRAQGTRGRARVRLLDVDGGTQLWAAAPIDVEEHGAFELEDLLVRVVTEAVSERLLEGGARPMPTAVRAIVDRANASARLRTIPGMKRAVALAEEGLAASPGEPSLLCALGAALVLLYGLVGASEPDLAARAEEVTLRALAADPTLGDAYLTIGLLRIEQGELRAAARALHEAIARAPLLAGAHAALGTLLIETGNLDEGLRRLEVAIRLDSTWPGARLTRATVRAMQGDRAGAEVDLDEVGEARVLVVVRAVFWWNDREAAAALADAIQGSATGGNWEAAVPALRAFAAGEPYPDAERVMQALWDRARGANRNRCRAVEIATEMFATTGDRDAALRWLERAADLPFADLFWVDHCPSLDELRHEPRFAQVRAQVAARSAEVWR
jgi:tetratricopeptide (TPR) repeat protein/TolB-like protein